MPRVLLLRRKHDTFVLLAADHLECVQEVLLAVLDRCRVLLVAGEIGVDQLNETVNILGGHLWLSKMCQ